MGSSTNAVTIRRYRSEDLDALKAITVVAFEGVSIDRNIERLFGRIGGRSWQWRKARHIDADALTNPEGIFVAEMDGRPVGYITSRVDKESRIGQIPNMAVLPECQGHGIGKRLMEACLDYLRGVGMALVKIETLEQNPIGSRFYPSVGFQEVARQIHYAMRLDSVEN